VIAAISGITLLAVLGMPIFCVLGLIALLAFRGAGIDTTAVIVEMQRLATAPMLIAIPLFTLAGYLFAEAGSTARLVRVSRAFLGWFPGGLALVAIVACGLFTAFAGSSGVTIIAMGGILLPALLAERYPERFALGLVTAAPSLGILFPPSLPVIIFAYVAQVSVDQLFLAGILPGLMMFAIVALYGMRAARGVERQRFVAREVWGAVRGAAWELPLPFAVLGGIYSGVIAITEAAAITALYAFIVEVFIYRDIKLADLPRVIKEAMLLVSGILIVLATALGLTNYLIDAEVPYAIFDWMQGAIQSKVAFLLLLNVFLLLVGCLLDMFSALIVAVPLIVPIAQGYGVDLLHLGIIFLVNLEIGYWTPPVGMNLLIASFRFRRSVTLLYQVSVPFLVLLLIALLIITYVPGLSLLLPHATGGAP
jgi:tripartite ATP-independent transporter DctM subunit